MKRETEMHALDARNNPQAIPCNECPAGNMHIRHITYFTWLGEELITVPNFPNLFCLYGPGTNLAHGGSLIFQSECQVNYVMEGIRTVLTSGHRAAEPRKDVHDEYAATYQNEISQMVWAHWSVKHSHFKNPDGKVFTLSPWPIPTYWSWTKRFDADDYVFS